MKKIKLLMPLTGIATVSAAVFPMVACKTKNQGDSSNARQMTYIETEEKSGLSGYFSSYETVSKSAKTITYKLTASEEHPVAYIVLYSNETCSTEWISPISKLEVTYLKDGRTTTEQIYYEAGGWALPETVKGGNVLFKLTIDNTSFSDDYKIRARAYYQ